MQSDRADAGIFGHSILIQNRIKIFLKAKSRCSNGNQHDTEKNCQQRIVNSFAFQLAAKFVRIVAGSLVLSQWLHPPILTPIYLITKKHIIITNYLANIIIKLISFICKQLGKYFWPSYFSVTAHLASKTAILLYFFIIQIYFWFLFRIWRFNFTYLQISFLSCKVKSKIPHKPNTTKAVIEVITEWKT